MTWLENPQKVLTAAAIAVAVGFGLIGFGLTLLQATFG